MHFLDRFKTKRGGPVDFLVVGLGNPGDKYKDTRHNAGFMVIDALAKRHHITVDRMKFHGLTGDGMIGGKRCLLLKPTTFMNNSGQAVSEAASFYKIPMEQVLVIFDDVSLDVGRQRVRRKGTHGGHNGIRDITELCGSEDFPRIKLGVGKKPHPDYDLAKWVLSSFSKTEQKELAPAIERCCDAAELIIAGNTEEAMNRYNG